jgi:hypothetical protein
MTIFLWLPPLWRGPCPLFVPFWIPFTQGWFVPSLNEIGLQVMEKTIFFQYKRMQIFSLLWPLPTPGTMICTNLNLHYIRKLSWKYELLWLSASWEITQPHFCSFVIISPLKWTRPFICTILNLHQVWLKLACWFWRRFLFSI